MIWFTQNEYLLLFNQKRRQKLISCLYSMHFELCEMCHIMGKFRDSSSILILQFWQWQNCYFYFASFVSHCYCFLSSILVFFEKYSNEKRIKTSMNDCTIWDQNNRDTKAIHKIETCVHVNSAAYDISFECKIRENFPWKHFLLTIYNFRLRVLYILNNH